MKKTTKIVMSLLMVVPLCSCDRLFISNSSTSSSSSVNSSESSVDSLSSSTSMQLVESSSSSVVSSEVSSNSSLISSNNASSSSSESSLSIDIEETVTLNILELNDIHGYVYESSANPSRNISNIAYYINQVRKNKEYDNVVLIANGDTFQGTAFSNLSHGKSVVNVMNEMNFDMMGIGNHEFDWGLDEVLKLWDGDKTNGEANFPLINGNVRDSNNGNKLVGEDNLQDNILPYTIVDKAGIKVGLISYIGDQTNSICQNKFGSYYIDCYGDRDSKFLKNVELQAKEVKSKGADIIVLNIHEGDSSGIEELYYNNAFAALKDDDDYLIDAVINGHTHTNQSGIISRINGAPLPVVQAGSYCNYIGQIDLEYNRTTKEVTSVGYNTYRNSFTSYDSAVKGVLDTEYAIIEPLISKTLAKCTSSYVSRQVLGYWATGIMKQYSGSDVSFINTGGIRSTGDIENGTNITMKELYEVNPFDNSLVYVKVRGDELKTFYNRQNSNYYFNPDFDVSTIDTSKTYNLITIDYVYYSTYFRNVFKNIEEIKIDTLCARDLMVKDLEAHKNGEIDLNSTNYQIETNIFPVI